MASEILHLENASEFYIRSPMVRDLHDRISQWTWCGLTGGLIVGNSRCGKTTAIRILSDSIISRSGEDIRVFRVSYGKRDTATIRTVFDKIARSLGHEVKKSFTSDQLLEMICNQLSESALVNSARQVVMVIDEAQLLSINQLSAFAEIYNDLYDMHVNGVFFFVANKDQMAPLAAKILEKEYTYLRERFFAHLYEFKGISTSSELKKCLNEYDRYIMDGDSSMTATQYYCPKLYENGWRLAKLSKPYWYHYCETYRKPLGHDSWGMGRFIRATNLLLMDYLPRCNDPADEALLEACIVKSLAAAGIEPTLVSLAS